jgi:hypothetical protein
MADIELKKDFTEVSDSSGMSQYIDFLPGSGHSQLFTKNSCPTSYLLGKIYI